MCCLFTLLSLLGARAIDAVWWIARPARWDLAFSIWLWPALGIVFAPWTTPMWVLVSPGGVNGLDWLWVGIAIVVDVGFWSGGAWGNRGRGQSRSADQAERTVVGSLARQDRLDVAGTFATGL